MGADDLYRSTHSSVRIRRRIGERTTNLKALPRPGGVFSSYITPPPRDTGAPPLLFFLSLSVISFFFCSQRLRHRPGTIKCERLSSPMVPRIQLCDLTHPTPYNRTSLRPRTNMQFTVFTALLAAAAGLVGAAPAIEKRSVVCPSFLLLLSPCRPGLT